MLEHAARQHTGAPTSQQQETNLPVQLSELPIWEVIRDIMKHVSDEVVDLLPNDGASQVDHCIYGLPKRGVSASRLRQYERPRAGGRLIVGH
jgi:hypothetical protein